MSLQRKAGPDKPIVLLESFAGGAHSRSYRFSGLESVIRADTYDQVTTALAGVEQAIAQGKHAAGFVSYEAAAGLNPDLPVSGKAELPLVWFGVFAERRDCTGELPGPSTGDCQVSPPELTISDADYTSAVNSIREAIARGETYQVNFTTRQRFSISGDPFTLYRRMCRNQQAAFCAWLDIGTHRILSASPELFFALDDGRLTMKPMKGTAARRPRADDDQRQREQLAASTKDRAENLMIVDLVRNDLARIAETGSVQVPALFQVETYPTVHQMTSTVTARVRPEVGLTDIFRALFPCGSITGAPKRRTMEIIRELEGQPRGIYCGAIGYVSPKKLPPLQGEGWGGDGLICHNETHPPPNLPLERGGTKNINLEPLPNIEAVFSVAIRTAVVDTVTGKAEIGIGSGITWDSNAASELNECLDKSKFLVRDSGDFSLIESLRFDHQGYLLLDRHIKRLAGSATYFGLTFDVDDLRNRLLNLGHGLSGDHKVRVLLAADGWLTLESEPLCEQFRQPTYPHPNPLPEGEGTKGDPAVLIDVADERVDSSDPFLYHKTTRRALYDEQLRAHPGCYDCIFLNERDEVTEGSYNTIVISLKGEMLTPTLDSGLLPGVLREELLEVGAIREAVLTLGNLQAADTIWLVNSVRGWRECTMYLKQQGEPPC